MYAMVRGCLSRGDRPKSHCGCTAIAVQAGKRTLAGCPCGGRVGIVSDRPEGSAADFVRAALFDSNCVIRHVAGNAIGRDVERCLGEGTLNYRNVSWLGSC